MKVSERRQLGGGSARGVADLADAAITVGLAR